MPSAKLGVDRRTSEKGTTHTQMVAVMAAIPLLATVEENELFCAREDGCADNLTMAVLRSDGAQLLAVRIHKVAGYSASKSPYNQ
jgi:hypothetical protein